jgi:hypothetical protein
MRLQVSTLGNNAAFINIKRQDFLQNFLSENCFLLFTVDTETEPELQLEPELVKSWNGTHKEMNVT